MGQKWTSLTSRKILAQLKNPVNMTGIRRRSIELWRDEENMGVGVSNELPTPSPGTRHSPETGPGMDTLYVPVCPNKFGAVENRLADLSLRGDASNHRTKIKAPIKKS